MTDMKDILMKKHEGLTFEAKTAGGGLPKSLWETYSSFANAEGGVIVLGARERDDGSLEIVGVEDPDRFVKSFWDTINNRSKVSLNVLSDRDVSVETCEGKSVVVIRVPRAVRRRIRSAQRNGAEDVHAHRHRRTRWERHPDHCGDMGTDEVESD